MFGRATIRLGIGPHSSSQTFSQDKGKIPLRYLARELARELVRQVTIVSGIATVKNK